MTNSMRYHRLLRQKAAEHTIKYNKSTTKTLKLTAVNQYEACTCRQSISQQVDYCLAERERERCTVESYDYLPSCSPIYPSPAAAATGRPHLLYLAISLNRMVSVAAENTCDVEPRLLMMPTNSSIIQPPQLHKKTTSIYLFTYNNNTTVFRH